MFRICSLILLLVAGVAQAAPLIGRARVVDGDTIVLDGIAIRLIGIDAPETDQKCSDAAGRDYACGRDAGAALSQWLRGQEVTCTGEARDRYGRRLMRCEFGGGDVAGGDVAGAMVRAGWAFAYRRYSLEYVDAEAAAASAGLGVWQGDAVQPAVFRAGEKAGGQAGALAVGQTGGQTVRRDCAIKGNISASGHIYHVTGGISYGATRIDAARGERWFCTAREAEAAGWRKALR